MPKYTLHAGDRNLDEFDAGDVQDYLAEHGAKSVSVGSDGTITLVADSDPTATWESFSPAQKPEPLSLEEIAQAVVGTQADKQRLTARLAAVRARKKL